MKMGSFQTQKIVMVQILLKGNILKKMNSLTNKQTNKKKNEDFLFITNINIFILQKRRYLNL